MSPRTLSSHGSNERTKKMLDDLIYRCDWYKAIPWLLFAYAIYVFCTQERPGTRNRG